MRLTRKQHNGFFKYRQRPWYSDFLYRHEYYLSESGFLMYKLASIPYMVIATVAFPLMLLVHGVWNFNELVKEYKRLYRQKHYGAFSSDSVPSGANNFKDIVATAKDWE